MINDLYTRGQVYWALSNYRKLDSDAKSDLDRAIQSEKITGEMLQIIYLKFNMELLTMDCLNMLDMKYEYFSEVEDEMFETLEAVMNGYPTKRRKYKVQGQSLNEMLELLGNCEVSPFLLSTDAILEINMWLGDRGDLLAVETLRQQVEGMPQHIYDELFNAKYSVELYNCYTTGGRGADDRLTAQYQNNRVISFAEFLSLSLQGFGTGNSRKRFSENKKMKDVL